MMKLLAVALVVLVCISVAVVDGRKNKRGKDRLEHLEKRREFPRNRVKGKPNVVEPSNDAVANKVGNNVKKTSRISCIKPLECFSLKRHLYCA